MKKEDLEKLADTILPYLILAASAVLSMFLLVSIVDGVLGASP